MTVRSSSESLLKQLKDGLENGTSSSSVTLSLRYEDTQSELLMKRRSLHPDKINAIPARGGHKAAIPMTQHAKLVICSSSELTPQQFAEVGDVRQCEAEPVLFMLSITCRFSTNITSPAHGGRTMFWRAEAAIVHDDKLVSIHSDSPSFEYHPRAPKIGDAPRIHTVISDGRPSELIILYGDRLGAVNKHLQCHVSFPEEQRPELVLSRVDLDGSSLTTGVFTTRLPATVTAGSAMVYVRDSVDGVVSNKVPLKVLSRYDQPGVSLTALPAKGLTKRCPQLCDKPDQPSGASGGPFRNTNKRQDRADRPYDENSSPPISPDSEYDAPKMPPATPNPYETAYSQQDVCQTFDSQILCRTASEDWLTALVDGTASSPSMMEMDSQELKDCRTDFTRSLSEEWVLAAGGVA